MPQDQYRQDQIDSDIILRWIICALATVAMALCGIIWWNLTNELGELKIQVAVLQTQNIDLRLSVQDLKSRVNDLVEVLNSHSKKMEYWSMPANGELLETRREYEGNK